MPDLTSAQDDALIVLEFAGGWVEGGRRRSATTPRPYVNVRAANALVKKGLAEKLYSLHYDGIVTRDKWRACS